MYKLKRAKSKEISIKGKEKGMFEEKVISSKHSLDRLYYK